MKADATDQGQAEKAPADEAGESAKEELERDLDELVDSLDDL